MAKKQRVYVDEVRLAASGGQGTPFYFVRGFESGATVTEDGLFITGQPGKNNGTLLRWSKSEAASAARELGLEVVPKPKA